MSLYRRLFGEHAQLHLMVALLIALTLFFNIATSGRMLTAQNAYNLLAGNAYILVLAIGMLMVIVIGQIDLSVGSVAGFVSMTVALLFEGMGVPWWLGLVCGLLIGGLIGVWNGIWISRVGIPGFIVTLAGMMLFRGAIVWESRSLSFPLPREFQVLGAGTLPQWGPSWTGMNNSTLLVGVVTASVLVVNVIRRYRRRVVRGAIEAELWIPAVRCALIMVAVGALTWLFGGDTSTSAFPVPGLLLLILVFAYVLLTEHTAFGRHVYAVGGNAHAAALSGVNTRAVQFAVMVNMGVLAALAGMMFAGRATAAGPQDGTLWELDAIAAVFIGGAAVSGGVGTVTGAVLGGLVMAVLNNGLLLLGVPSDRSQVIKGLVLLMAVAFDMYSRRRFDVSLSSRLFAAQVRR